ncbi:MAG: GGDEF domain-containing protein [Sulfuricurvum sp.]|nr:GGDEF domain-containing protein [Sulfuricurvum sp.]
MTIRRFIILFTSIFILFMFGMFSAYYQWYMVEIFLGITGGIGGLLIMMFKNMERQSKELHDALDVSHNLDEILRTILDINQNLLLMENSDESIQACCTRLSKHSGYGLCWIAVKIDKDLIVRGCSDDSLGVLHHTMTLPLDDPMSFAPSVSAYHENSIVILDHLQSNTSLATWSFIAKEKGYGSIVALPLMTQNNDSPFGVLTLYSKHSEGFSQQEIEMIQELASDISVALYSHTQRSELTRHLGFDSVSGLPNRVSLIDYLSSHHVSALAILNIDRFSDINDVYGVAIGDQVLAGYGQWLRKKIDKTKGILLYNIGSDEYALVFDEHSNTEDNLCFLEYLIDKTEEASFVIEGIEVVLSISVGFDPKSEKLIENATRALKQAKIDRTKLSVYTPLLGERKEQANNIEWYKEIKEALEEERIVPYFQPIVDNKSHKIIKYEALIRLIKRDGTVISPCHFLDISKKIRLYPRLTKAMIDKVVERFETCYIPVSINLSTEDLLNAELADYIEEQLERYTIGDRIIFEILESEGIINYTQVSTFIERFKAIGCSFAIDDFGSGYSNFEHLLRLNIDTLKIDGSLIKNLPYDKNAQIIVRHICEFAHEIGLATIAEFVADEAIYNAVRDLGIDASQGYYFYEPLAAPLDDENRF